MPGARHRRDQSSRCHDPAHYRDLGPPVRPGDRYRDIRRVCGRSSASGSPSIRARSTPKSSASMATPRCACGRARMSVARRSATWRPGTATTSPPWPPRSPWTTPSAKPSTAPPNCSGTPAARAIHLNLLRGDPILDRCGRRANLQGARFSRMPGPLWWEPSSHAALNMHRRETSFGSSVVRVCLRHDRRYPTACDECRGPRSRSRGALANRGLP